MNDTDAIARKRYFAMLAVRLAGTAGAVFGLFLLGRVRRPVPPNAAVAGLVCGFVAVLAVWLPSQFDRPILAWPWFALIGAGTTVLVALVFARFLPARPDGHPATPANRRPVKR